MKLISECGGDVISVANCSYITVEYIHTHFKKFILDVDIGLAFKYELNLPDQDSTSSYNICYDEQTVKMQEIWSLRNELRLFGKVSDSSII